MAIKQLNTNGVSEDEELGGMAVMAMGEPVEEAIVDLDDLLAADDLGIEYIRLPHPYNGGVRVRPLSMKEMHALRKASRRKVRNAQGKVVEEYDEEQSNKVLIRMSLIEPAMTAEKVDALFLKNNKLATAILRVVSRINGLTEEEAEAEVAAAEAEFPE